MPTAFLWDVVLYYHRWRHGIQHVTASLQKTSSPLQIGVLGAAAINTIAIYDAVSTHPDATIAGVAARSRAKAEAQIARYKLKDAKGYGSYDELLAVPNIDAVYIPLPNGLHCEWTCKAMRAGKHVLCEKPLASNAEQVREIMKVSQQTGKVVLEAFHWRLYPAAHVLKDIVESGRYGKVREVRAHLGLPAWVIGKDDIRFNYDLAGGASMDMLYVFSTSSYYAAPSLRGAEVEVLEAKPRKNGKDARIDDAMEATYTVRTGEHAVVCHVRADLGAPPLYGFIPKIWAAGDGVGIDLEKATISYGSYAAPYAGHAITITDKATGNIEKLTAFTDGPQWKKRGQPWWTTYRYQLEAFVDRVRAVQGGAALQDLAAVEGPWISLEESEAVMELVDKVYTKAGMPKRVWKLNAESTVLKSSMYARVLTALPAALT
ncbi:hypothetical protein BAUCODRAFT_149758 [Baudoinia panamericana UAMH 10762]|uniref:D-xylose 1-dehydrogenase (NADP(+), D-xylono-1,5-lactone-forming) n=1 Tax=Baudoinia panamericana (strain UAMH 10762) TaxID=717646 RepID=M2MDK6_BAUPA|nr:uncharacterized protein BAUCODRAFT_149758 [Baudoinia panamericana UAMH 10762]EMC94626.1 hypothetical protein BAUCODRAFT_149758 [Baudoinia panamericana UAMH 10762]